MGGWNPCRSDQITFKLILAKVLWWCQPPRRANNHSCSPSSILEDCNYSQNSDIDTNSIVAQGTLGLFLAASVDCVRLIAKLLNLFTRNLSLRNPATENCWRWNLTTWTLGSQVLHFIIHVACSHKYSPKHSTGCPVHLFKKTIGRSIICCPIFELPNWMRCILPFRVLLCHEVPFNTSLYKSTRNGSITIPPETGFDGWGVVVFNVSLQGGVLIDWRWLRIGRGAEETDGISFKSIWRVFNSKCKNAWKPWQKLNESRPSIIPSLNPRNTTVLILAPFTPTISPYWMFFLAPESKIKDPKIHGKVNEITQFITRCQTFRSIEDQCPVFGEVTIRTQQLKLLWACSDLTILQENWKPTISHHLR